MKEIKVSASYVAKVDDEDYERLSRKIWRYSHGYALTGHGSTRAYMHQLVLCKLLGVEIDHINRNGLDNRKENLRHLTISENRHNTGLPRHNTSGHKGVVFIKGRGKWAARIEVRGKPHSLGWYKTFDEAVIARQKAERRFLPEVYAIPPSDVATPQ